MVREFSYFAYRVSYLVNLILILAKKQNQILFKLLKSVNPNQICLIETGNTKNEKLTKYCKKEIGKG
jgi:hypothetical protein